MDCRVLQLVIESAHRLREVNYVTTMKPFALVSIRDNHNNLHSSEEKTLEDTEGGSNPTWNSPVTFNNLDITKAKESNLELVVKLMSLRTDNWFRDKEIGEVRVFITKLLEGFGGKAKADAVVAEKQMRASVMTTDEKPQGTLVFSYKFDATAAPPLPAIQTHVAAADDPSEGNNEGIAGTALNTTGLTSSSDAAAAPPLPAIQTQVAAAVDHRAADEPSEYNNDEGESEDDVYEDEDYEDEDV